MDENLDMIPTNSEVDTHRQLLAKWLGFLYKIQIAAIILPLFGAVPYLSILAVWLNRAVVVCLIIAMVNLSSVNVRYRNTAVLQGIVLAGDLIMMVKSNSFLSLAVSIASLLAAYQQYQAHSELMENLDAELSRKWHSLFLWEIGVGLLGGCITVAGVVIGVLGGTEPALLVTISIITGAVFGVALEVVYLLYLKKTLAYFLN